MSNRVMANPALDIDIDAVLQQAADEGLEGHVLFQTSGSGGEAKWVALSRSALERSAGAVNQALAATASDRWVRALPEFHVAGYAIGVRARLAGAEVSDFEGKWHPARFLEVAGDASLCSLVPTQLYDLVEAGVRAPSGMRALLVGGGALADSLRNGAEALGWPVRTTYGMTEAGSTVALDEGEGSLRLLDIWRARLRSDGELEIAGEALFTKYLGGDEQGGWFRTGDRARLDADVLGIVGRCDHVVKVLGELVDLEMLERRLEEGFVAIAVPDARAGHRLILVGDREGVALLNHFNAQATGFERFAQFVRVDSLPRTVLGKLRRKQLTDQISEKIREA